MKSLEKQFIEDTGQQLRFHVWKRDRKYFKTREELKKQNE